MRDQSIQIMDESCGYIEQVDDSLMKDDMIVGFVPGQDLGATLTIKHRKEKERKFRKRKGRRNRVRD